jgi:hypothetical protein
MIYHFVWIWVAVSQPIHAKDRPPVPVGYVPMESVRVDVVRAGSVSSVGPTKVAGACRVVRPRPVLFVNYTPNVNRACVSDDDVLQAVVMPNHVRAVLDVWHIGDSACVSAFVIGQQMTALPTKPAPWAVMDRSHIAYRYRPCQAWGGPVVKRKTVGLIVSVALLVFEVVSAARAAHLVLKTHAMLRYLVLPSMRVSKGVLASRPANERP